MPLLCFGGDTVPIRTVAWAPFDCNPFRPLRSLHPAPRIIYSLDWLSKSSCIIMSFEDGTMRTISLAKAANDFPVTGEIYSGKKQPGLHGFSYASFAIWSVQVSRITAASGFVHGSHEKKKDHIRLFELKKGDLSIKVTNWGATLVSVILPDKNGVLGDIVLGYDSPMAYTNDSSYFGATVGRIGNRIGGAQFTLNGIHYKLVANEGNNTLHSGPKAFSDVLWDVKKYIKDGDKPRITFSYLSFDGEGGFPGDLLVTVSYILGKNSLSIIMKAKALNKATPVNLLNHAYWNLGNHNSGNILNEVVQIFGSQVTLFDDNLIPTGKFASVKGTPYDFLEPHTVGERINQLAKTNGYNTNYVLDGAKGKKTKLGAIVVDKKSGRVMKLFTNAPGLQFYTANFVKNEKGKGGFVYQPRSALCLESQAFPDSVNHPNFPSTIVTPQNPYKHVLLLKFSTKIPHAFSHF